MKKLAGVLAVVCFAGCNGGNNINKPIVPSQQTVDETQQFLSMTAGSRWDVNGGSLSLNTNGKFELLTQSAVVQSPEAQNQNKLPSPTCNLRVTGQAAYYGQKVSPNGDIQAKDLELQVAQVEVLPLAASPNNVPDTTGVCQTYANDITKAGTFDFQVSEFSSTYIAIPDFSFNIVDPSNPSSYLLVQSLDVSENDTTFFLKQGAQLDVTKQTIQDLSNNYKLVGGINVTPDKDGKVADTIELTVDAGLNEVQILNTGCGMDYLIDVKQVMVDTQKLVLTGKLSESAGTLVKTADCSAFDEMMQNISTAGISLNYMTQVCSDQSCSSTYTDLTISAPTGDASYLSYQFNSI
jgi:hypothetical protein